MNRCFLTTVIVLTVIICAGGQSTACESYPVASLSCLDNTVLINETVYFDSTDSYDPDGGSIIKYEWDVDGNGQYDYTDYPGDGLCEHTYTEVNNYLAKVRVTDNETWTSTTTCMVYVRTAEGQTVTVNAPGGGDYDFATIQAAIDWCIDGDTVEVYPGTYNENVDCSGKNITLTSTDPCDVAVVAATVIQGDGLDSVVTLAGTETSGYEVKGFTITTRDGDQLVAHWAFDEGQGDTAYDSIGSNDGTLINDPCWSTGQIDGALSFDGENDYVEITGYKGITGTNARTCALWIKKSSSAWGDIISWGDHISNGEKWQLWVDSSGHLRLTVLGGYVYAQYTNLNDGNWHHVAATFEDDGTPNVEDVKLYVDGKEDTTLYSPQAMNTGSAENVRIGLLRTDNAKYFDGLIDDVRIYSRALGALEIAELAENPALIGHWKLDESEGHDVSDSSGKNNAGYAHVDEYDLEEPDWEPEGGRIDGTLVFDGVDDYVDLGYSDLEDPCGLKPPLPITLSAWINIDIGMSTRTAIISLDDETSVHYGLSLIIDDSAHLCAILGDGTGGSSTSRRIEAGQVDLDTSTWRHVAVVATSPEDLKLYVDGQRDEWWRAGTGGDIVYSEYGTASIGARSGGTVDFFSGMIDDVRVYKTALTEAEVKHLAGSGSGIDGNGSSATINRCVITNNTSGYQGGGINNCAGTISNCVVVKNYSYTGGGLADCSGSIENCVITDNTAEHDGGGLYNCDTYITNCTVANNKSLVGEGGGIYNDDGASPVLTNCILWGNTDSGSITESAQIYGGTPSVEYSCIQDDTPGADPIPFSDPCDPCNCNCNVDEDPLFVDPNNPAGGDRLYASRDDGLSLQSGGSPCVDTGIDDPCGITIPPVDITGDIRIRDGDHSGNPAAQIDMGAYELPTMWYVDDDPCSSGNGYTPDTPFITIQEGINAASGGDVVVVNTGSYDGDIDFGGKAITLQGPNPYDWDIVGDTVITCAGSTSGFHFDSGEDLSSVVKGFTITSCPGYYGYGGGIYCNNSNPTISNCVITGNGGSGAIGGGILCENGANPRIINCIINDNEAGWGGGIFVWESNPTIVGCVFSDNEASCSGPCNDPCTYGGVGGGICLWLDGDATIINCTFSGNIADTAGGAIYNWESSPAITNSILWDNGDEVGIRDVAGNPTKPTFSFCDIEGCGGSPGWDPCTFGVDGGSNIDNDPCLSAADDDYRLQVNSPCFDIGDNLAVPIYVAADLDGFARIIGPAVNMGAYESVYPLPEQASDFGPVDETTEVSINDVLSWTASEDVLSHNVYFSSTYEDVVNGAQGAFQGNRTETTYDPPGTMDCETTYYWRIDEIGPYGMTEGVVLSFITVTAPGQVSEFSPVNGEEDVLLDVTLEWEANVDAASHDLYFGLTDPPPFIQNQLLTTYDPTLQCGKTYYWRIDEMGQSGCGNTTGDVWSFTTIAGPGPATSPVPEDGVKEVSIDADLNWTAGSSAVSHDVYFGDNKEAVANADTGSGEFQCNQPGTTFDPCDSEMEKGTTYYWRIDEVAADTPPTKTTGAVWSFATECFYVAKAEDGGSDTNPGTYEEPFETIQHAIDQCANGDAIVVKPGTYYETFSGSGNRIEKNIILKSLDPFDPEIVDSTIIDGQSSSYYVIDIYECSVKISGFTITGFGGTINNVYGINGDLRDSISQSLEVSNCVILGDNELPNSYPRGINLLMGDDDTFVIKNCIIKDNEDCGLLINLVIPSSPISTGVDYADIIVQNCAFVDNAGSAIQIKCTNGTNDSTIDLINSVFCGNSSTNGGAISLAGSPAYPIDLQTRIINCIFYGNSATGVGDDIYKSDMDIPDIQIDTCFIGTDTIDEDISGGYVNVNNSILWGDAGNEPRLLNPANADGLDDLYFTADDGLSITPISDCADKGNDAYAPETDICGNPRTDSLFMDEDTIAQSDIGAYEAPLVNQWHVKEDGTGGGFSWDNAFSDLQDALVMAGEYGGDIWVAAGTYDPCSNDQSVSFEITSPTGPEVDTIRIYGGFAGNEDYLSQRDLVNNITILSGDLAQDDGPGFTNMSDNSYHVLTVTDTGSAFTALLDGFTITGGNASSSAPAPEGGGIYNTSSNVDLTVSNCKFIGNSANYGGGMYNGSGTPSINNCTFSQNNAGFTGGGMYNYSCSLTLSNCAFSQNLAGTGAGISNYLTDVVISDCVLEDNEAGNGAGLDHAGGSAELTRCSFVSNKSLSTNINSGGGGLKGQGCTISVDECVFIDNSAAADGGAILASDVTLTLTNFIMVENTADRGGAMCNSGSSVTLTNSTLTRNSANIGGAIYIFFANSPTTIMNSILWDNLAPTGKEIYNQDYCYITYSDIEGCGFSGDSWDSSIGIDGGGNLDVVPIFYDSSNPAGPDGIYRTRDDGLHLCVYDKRDGNLQQAVGDYCIDSGDSSVAPETDITGRNRSDVPYIPNVGDSELTCVDMGAYESPAVWYVASIFSGNGKGKGWSWNYALTQVEKAIAKAAPGDEIWVATGMYTLGLGDLFAEPQRSDEFYLDKQISLYGGFSGNEYRCYERNWVGNETILSGNLGDAGSAWDNTHHVLVIEADDVVVDGFTIRDGSATGYDDDKYGGGIYVKDVQGATIANCIIRDNHASSGGGVYNENSTLTFRNCMFFENYGCGFYNLRGSQTLIGCLFSHNTGGKGGGLRDIGGTSIIVNTIFRENRALSYNRAETNYAPGEVSAGGSALYAGGGSSDVSHITLINCLFSGNRTQLKAEGAVYVKSFSSINATNCTFTENYGGAISLSYYYDPMSTLANCVIYDNYVNDYMTGDPIEWQISQYFNAKFINCDIKGCGGSGEDWWFDVEGSDGGGNIDSDPCFVEVPEFYDETVDDGLDFYIFVADASLYAVGDIIEYDDGYSRTVTVVDYENNAIEFIPTLVDGGGLSVPSTGGITIKNWGRYAVTKYPRGYDELGPFFVCNKIARLRNDSSPISPCIDTGTEELLPQDDYDLNEDGSITDPIPFDLMGIPRCQYLTTVPSDSVDMGVCENGGLGAADEIITINEDDPCDIQLDVTDQKGGSPTYTIVVQPKHGTVSSCGSTCVTYTPHLHYNGSDEFQYKAYDGVNYSEIAKVTVTINSVDDSPVAVDDLAWINSGDASITINVLANDSDPDIGHELDITSIISDPCYGDPCIVDNKIIYTPDNPSSIAEEDSFVYEVEDVTDTLALSDSAEVIVRLNHDPCTVDDVATTNRSVMVIIDILQNDDNGDPGFEQALSVNTFEQGSDGKVAYHEGLNKLLYMPENPDPCDPCDSFTYTAIDEFGASSDPCNPATVTINFNDEFIKDTDNDKISDQDEVNVFYTNPYNSDTDGDGLPDAEELILGADPRNPHIGNYYASKLPYTTTFGANQGYIWGYWEDNVSLDRQGGWEVDDGVCNVMWKTFFITDSGWNYWGGYIARLAGTSTLGQGTTTISKEFIDEDSNNDIIRVKLYPKDGAMINIYSGDTVMAGAKFGSDNKIYYWNGTDWSQSTLSWNEWPEEGTTAQKFPEHNYAMMLQFELLRGSGDYGQYKLYWDSVSNGDDDPSASGAFNLCGGVVDDAYPITKIELQSDDDDFEVHGLYINGSNTSNYDITSPCYCEDLSDQVTVPIIGACHSPNTSGYTLWYSPSDLYEWKQFNQSIKPVNENGVLAYWNTSQIPNGLYDIILVPEMDFYVNGYPYWEYDDIIIVQYLTVSSQIKGNTFHYEEEPDISIPWPGEFPFELKRTYDGRHSNEIGPFWKGWTHNHQITLIEDAIYYESENTVLGECADYDNNLLAFGYIFVQYENGSTHLFRHRTGSFLLPTTEFIYTPWPEDGSGDYVKRISYLDNIWDYEIGAVEYSLHRRDGTVIKFKKIEFDQGQVPVPYGICGHYLFYKWGSGSGEPFKFRTQVETKSDRFGNTLEYDWEIKGPNGEFPVLKKVYYDNDGTEISIDLTSWQYPFVDLGGPRGSYRWLIALAELNVTKDQVTETKKGVYYGRTFPLDPIPRASRLEKFYVFSWGHQTNEDGEITEAALEKDTTVYWHCVYGDSSSFTDKILFIGPHFYFWDPISIALEYDGNGSLESRTDFIRWNNYLTTYYSRDYFTPEGSFGNEKWLRTATGTEYKTAYAVYNDKGQPIEQYTITNDGTLTKRSRYEYNSYAGYNSHPLAPSDVYESWEVYNSYDPCDPCYVSTVGRHTRTLFNKLGLNMNVDYDKDVDVWNSVSQSVYDLDDNLLSHNELKYHGDDPCSSYSSEYKYYGLVTDKISYQEIDDTDPCNPVYDKPVHTKYVYGDHDGNIAEDQYLVKKEVLQDDNATPADPCDDDWAVTYYKYDHLTDTGPDSKNAYALTTVIEPYDPCDPCDPFDIVTIYEYDDGNPLRKLVKAGKKEPGQNPSDIVPVQRYYHNEIGQQLLMADQYGNVQKQYHDDFGDIYKVETFCDPCALVLSAGNFDPDTRYASGGAVWPPRSTTIRNHDWLRRRIFEKAYSQERVGGDISVQRITYIENTNLPEFVDFDDDDPCTSDSYIGNIYDNRRLKLSEYKVDEITKHWWFTDYYYDAQDRVSFTLWWDHEDSAILKLLANGYYGSGQKAYNDVWGIDSEDKWELQRRTDYKYNVEGKQTQQIVTYGYDGDTPLELTTSYGYDVVGNKTSITKPSGNITYYDYDNANRKIANYFAAAESTGKIANNIKNTTEYYPNNLVRKSTSYDYNARGHSKLAQVELKYDKRSRVNKVAEAITANGQGEITDEAITTIDYTDAHESSITVDSKDRAYATITKELDSEDDKVTTIFYNERGQTIKTKYPTNDYKEVQFNGDGSLKKKLVFDPCDDPQWIEYDYDIFNRLEKTDYPGAGDYLTFEYDGFGRKTKVTDSRNNNDKIGGTGGYANKISYEYNALSRIVGVTDQDGYLTRYLYRTSGQKQSVSVFEPTQPEQTPDKIYDVDYEYDLVGRLKSVSEPELPFGSRTVADIGYDESCACSSMRSELNYYLDGDESGSNIVTTNYTYNKDDLLTGYTTTGGITFSFDATDPCYPCDPCEVCGIDGLGRLTYADEELTKVDSSTRSHRLTYTYDMRSQLTQAQITNIGTGDWTGTYSYKKDGNMNQREIESTTTDIKYDIVSDPCNEDDGDFMTKGKVGANDLFTLTWAQSNGTMKTKNMVNETKTTTLTHNWDNRLRLAQVDNPSPPDIDVLFRYDPDGNRIRKQISDDTTTTYKYIVDTVGQLPTVLVVVDLGALPNDPCDDTIANSYIYDDRSRVIAQHAGDMEPENRYFYLSDRLGSVRLVLDFQESGSSIEVANRYTYDPFGNELDDETETTVDNPFMFTGQWFDEEIGQYYLRARQYDPYIGRFTSRDPACGSFQKPMTLNVYMYALNNPINNVDPTGRFSMIGVKQTAQHVADAFQSRGELITIAVNAYRGDLTNLFDLADQLTIIQNAHAMMFYDPQQMEFAIEHIQHIAQLMLMGFADSIGVALRSTDSITEACDWTELSTCISSYVVGEFINWPSLTKFASGTFLCTACPLLVATLNPIAPLACAGCWFSLGEGAISSITGAPEAFRNIKTCVVDNCGSD